MYQLDVASLRAAGSAAGARIAIPRTILLLGVVSCLTDISSEMVSSVLPIYLLSHLQFSPLQFGVVDGLYQGVSATVRLASGIVSDRWGQYKWTATFGYALSAVCKLGLLVASAPAALATTIAIDRCGKGVRTAPRDAMISLSARGSSLATAFGVHRALDTLGVVIGPLTAFAILRARPETFDNVFVVSFAVALIGVGVLAFLVEDCRKPHDAVVADTLGSPLSVVLSARLRSVITTGMFMNVTVMSDAFLYLILQRQSAGALHNLPLYYLGSSLAFLAFAVPAGRLADRVGRVRVYLTGHLVMVCVYVAMLLSGHVSTLVVVVLLCGHGAYYAATDGVLAALTSSLIPERAQGTGLGVVATGTSVARFGGSVMLGALWTWFGPSGVVLFCAVGTCMVCIGAMAVLLPLDRAQREASA